MKICVVGLWHLGAVTAACLADLGIATLAIDEDELLIENFKKNIPPISEPNLSELLKKNINLNNLAFTSTLTEIKNYEYIWITYDTDVDEGGAPKIQALIDKIKLILKYVSVNSTVIISSQLPVGSTKLLKKLINKKIDLVYIPENLRLGNAIQIFKHPDRLVVGIDNDESKIKLEKLLSFFDCKIIFMSLAAAEMTKHAINSFLGMSVTFINEIASLCESLDINVREVEEGLKSENRIGRQAYLRPGNAIGGNTLLRDVFYLNEIGNAFAKEISLLSAIIKSNEHHAGWSKRLLNDIFPQLKNKKVTIIGLSYKTNSDTLRGSPAIQLSQWLYQHSAKVFGFDPLIKTLPAEFAHLMTVKNNIRETLALSDAIILLNESDEFNDLDNEELCTHLNDSYLIDPNGYLLGRVSKLKKIKYFSVGVKL